MRQRQRGVNLIEVVVTISVLGILIATALPSMGDWMKSVRVRQLAETTQNGLQRARSEALKRNRVVTYWMVAPGNTSAPDASCELATDSAAWVVSIDDPTGKCDESASPTSAPRIVETYGPGKTADGIIVAGLAADGTTPAGSVSFNGFGQRVGTGTLAMIDIRHPDASARRLRIQISPSGGIRMCDRDVAAPDPRACT